MNKKDQQLIEKLSSDEEKRLASINMVTREHRQALKERKELEGEYRKAGMARVEAQAIIDRIQREVEPVEKVILKTHNELVSLGMDTGIPISTIPEEKGSG